ncbi:WD40 repeat-like protein [Lactarius hatsudake]|nr:WD40 repeat-like protein [Lactarius hatsudake]
MPPSPNLPPQHDALFNCTNLTLEPTHSFDGVSSPPGRALVKRSRLNDEGGARLKRLKYITQEPLPDEKCEAELDKAEEDGSIAFCAARRTRTFFHARQALAMSRPGVTSRSLPLPTRSQLRAYVSSHKTDVFKCFSERSNSFLTPPYACAYSHAAKRGAVPHLAVATEQGTVYIWDTSKREELGRDPKRVDHNIHENGIFDLQWSPDDTLLATCSGDHTTRITDITTGKTLHVLRGHTSTVKTVIWDPRHDSLLSTGGRDGGIRVWDLRIAGSTTHGLTSHSPVTVIDGAHGEDKQANRGGRRKLAPTARTVTSLVYTEGRSEGLISAGSFDGILRLWDLRQPISAPRAKGQKRPVQPATMSAFDPTITEGARRARGLASVAVGTGPTTGLLFGLGVDSRVHTYAASTLLPLSQKGTFKHPSMHTNSFWVRLALSPDGKSLVSGSSGTDKGASAFLFDVSQTALAAPPILPDSGGIELPGQKGEVGGVDWAHDMLATCSDDGTVRVWRRDPEIRQQCDLNADARWEWTWGIDR